MNPTVAVYRVSNNNVSQINANNLIAFGPITSVDNLKYHAVVPKFGTLQPAKTAVAVTYKGTTTGNVADAAFTPVLNEYEFEFADTERHVMSKSNELTGLAGAKSATFNLTLTTQSDFVSPVINLSRKSAFFVENLINNDASNEHTRYGNAQSKYVSKKVVLADGQEAEDLKVYLTAYRPADTDIKVYAKFKSAEDPQNFDDKVWTELEYLNDGEFVYSSPSDIS